jgi:tight adherence protein B
MALTPTVIFALVSSLAAAGGTVILLADQRQRQNERRISSVVHAYRPARSVSPSLRRAAVDAGASSTVAGLLPYLGVKADRPHLYPISWKLLLLVALIAALLLQLLASTLVGSFMWLFFPVCWVYLARQLFRYYHQRYNQRLYRQLPDALSMIVRSVRVGVTVQESLRVVGEEAQTPTSIEFKRLVDELRVGTPLGEALIRLAGRSGLIEYRFFAVALSLQSQSGGSLSETLENLADIVRKRVALRARGIALASEARLTMYVLAGLPFFTMAALLVIDPDYLTVLFTTRSGKILLVIGISLLAMGLYSMRLIIRRGTS